MVVTGDRDTFQLIEPGVRVMATGRGITETKVYDRDAVIDRYGIPPELIPDFYGLKGDTSDNIPGVPGIGDKTASQLLQQFGDLEARAGEHRRDLRRQAQGEPDQPRRGRAHVQAAGHRDARRADVDVDLDELARARARPLAPARDVSRVRAARPAAAAGGGAGRRGGGRAARAAGGAGRGHAPREVAPAELASLEGELLTLAAAAAAPRAARGPAARLPTTRSRCASPPTRAARGAGRARPRRSAEVLAAGRAAAGGPRLEDASPSVRATFEGARRARARHDGGRLPDRPRPARLPAARSWPRTGLGAEVEGDGDGVAGRGAS